MAIPLVDFHGTQVSRLIVGDNPVNGHSYIPEIISSDDMLDYYTEQNLLTAMAQSERLGRTTDGLCDQGECQTIRDRLKMIRDAGIKAGLGTHVPKTGLRADEENRGADLYATCLHNTRIRGAARERSFIAGRPKHLEFSPEDRRHMFGVIRRVDKPCTAFKILSGGQVFYAKSPDDVFTAVADAIRETFAHIKPADIAAIGSFQRDKNQLQANARAVPQRPGRRT